MIDFADVAITERPTPPQWWSEPAPPAPPSLFAHMVDWDAVAAKFIQEQTLALVKSLDAKILGTQKQWETEMLGTFSLPEVPIEPPPFLHPPPPYTIYDCLDW